MAEDKKTFLQGKMNQDIDDRILPNGEYRSAQNIQVTTSEGSDVGSIQNILGNTKIQNNIPGFTSYNGLETIGSFFDEKNNRIFYFVTNYTCVNSGLTGLVGASDGPQTAEQSSLQNNENLFCGIFMATQANTDSLSISLLASGLFLNFSKTHVITGVNLLESLLFFTDGLNQPRKININKAIENSSFYNTEDKISVAKFAPFMPALLLDYETTTLNNNTPTTTEPTSSMELSSQNDFPEDFLKEKFIRFSYRYRFIDGEYSTIAPFTQVCFIPKTNSYNITQLQKVFKKGEVYFQDTNGISDGMVNDVTAINLNIILPSKNIKSDLHIDAIEILYKESDNNLIRAVELNTLENADSSTGVYQYKYKSTLPYKTLPQDQTTRVYDNVPLSAKAQEIVSNRVVYGNYVENRKLPKISGNTGLNFSVGSTAKYDTLNAAGNADFNNYYLHKEYPFHSIKQRRTYEVGVVLSDKFGRQSPVLTSTSGVSSITVAAKDVSFHSSSWDTTGVISSTSPGNADYCGDALTITFNEQIPNAYANGSLIPINLDSQGSVVDNPTVLVTPEQTFFSHPTFLNVFRVLIEGFTMVDNLNVGDYLKGQETDFVKIKGVEVESGNIILYCEGPASLSYKNYTGTTDSPVIETSLYNFYSYKLVPHGWYSYRVVVKQPEQEYYNVYSPGVFTFDNDRDEDKTYIPIVTDSINKITRDTEFTSTQEVGLSTSKNRIYPKVVPADSASSKQSSLGLLDVISIGTAKEQGLKNDNDDVFAFVYEADKNPLIAQIPYGDDAINIGTSTASGLAGTTQTIQTTTNNTLKLINQSKTLTWTDTDSTRGAAYAVSFKAGGYLKGKNKDLVKIIKFKEDSNVFTVDCDGAIDEVNLGLDASDIPETIDVRVYDYKYGTQDKISVFETKPFESTLDIYYETSTAGLIHELNEILTFPTNVSTINLINKNFSEDIQYFETNDANAGFLNQYVATLQLLDQFDNELTFGTAPSQIATCNIVSQQGIFHPNISGALAGTEQDVDRFEIVLDENDNKFKIKPKNGSGGNFVYYPQEFPVKYVFAIQVTNAAGQVEPPIQVEIDLQNVAPNISSGNTASNIFTIGEVVYSFEADNGSFENSEAGLFYQDASLGENFLLGATIGFDTNGNPAIDFGGQGVEFQEGQSFFVDSLQSILFDSDGNPRPELLIDNSTGDITLTELFQGTLDVILQIEVIDSSDFGLISSNINGAEVGGISTVHNLRIIASTGLIVLEVNNPNHVINEPTGSVNVQLGSVTSTIDIFNQTSSAQFNNYWTQSRTPEQIDAGMLEIPQEEAGLFLYSKIIGYRVNPGRIDKLNKKAFALDIVDNTPFIKIYEPLIDEIVSTGGDAGSAISNNSLTAYHNNWLKEGNGHIVSKVGGSFLYNTGIQWYDNAVEFDEDIDGGSSDLLSVEDVDSEENLWQPDLFSSNANYGNSVGTTGAFKVYNNDGGVTTSIAKPGDRNQSTQNRIVKTYDTVTIGEFDYNVLYEITENVQNINNVHTSNELIRVFLCRDLE